VPAEDMRITVSFRGNSEAGDAADTLRDPADPDDVSDIDLTGITVQPAGVVIESIDPKTGEVVFRVPEGFGDPDKGWSGNDITFTVPVKDDHLSENTERFDVVVSKVKGSEGTIGANDKVTTAITDDETLAQADPDNTNTILDGPLVHLKGTLFVSESGGNAQYTVYLTDENGDPYAAQEPITITLTYEACPGDGCDGAQPREAFEILTTTITINPGDSSANFEVRIPDNALTENNSRFEVSIDGVSGNEARLPVDGSDSVKTVIIDDTQLWNYDGIDQGGYGAHDGFTVINPGDAHSATNNTPLYDGPTVNMTGTTAVWENTGTVTYTFTIPASDKSPSQDITVSMTLKPNDVTELEDFFGPNYDLASITTKLETLNNGRGVTNVRFIDADDPDQGITFDFVIGKGYSYSTLEIPIYNDDLTEVGSGYTLSMSALTGAEAKLGTSSVTTTIRDEGHGPSVALRCYDPDLDSYQYHATIGSNPKDLSDTSSTRWDPTPYVTFRTYIANANTTAQENLSVTIVLRNANNEIYTGNRFNNASAQELADMGVTVANGTEAGQYIYTLTTGGWGCVYRNRLPARGWVLHLHHHHSERRKRRLFLFPQNGDHSGNRQLRRGQGNV
ncbi:hypothetical protein LJC26_08840, partial [Desulfovibrio sp. OttesenSCG-928-O18]|nr:hypothetical protein [Desulfovibrio sp. OttesenSCG-928-O18]